MPRHVDGLTPSQQAEYSYLRRDRLVQFWCVLITSSLLFDYVTVDPPWWSSASMAALSWSLACCAARKSPRERELDAIRAEAFENGC